MTNLLREFAERVREKVRLLSGYGPPLVIEADSEEEADRLYKEFEAEWGPERDVLMVIWSPEEAAEIKKRIGAGSKRPPQGREVLESMARRILET